ncbi:cupin domain-containing protein [Curtobacterium sp. ISL-83]|uniref:cupin domain-containing protein n=1 Tax=Curtobacterium sp. ISL-83 TaxID=2819145 RepID=UPI001BE52C6F|nr:cupin domain-containing protein [Curtobacterium sp. ISL-83]MBT2504250.1 cupin domain-containing protein [Curtobacterium sp. ISL-83]
MSIPTPTLDVTVLKHTPSGEPVEGYRLDEEHPAPFKASRWSLAPGFTSDWDQHDVIELWFVSAGTGIVSHGGVTFRVNTGDAVYMPSRTRHRVHNDGTEPITLFSAWWAPEKGDANRG